MAKLTFLWCKNFVEKKVSAEEWKAAIPKTYSDLAISKMAF